MAQTMVNFRMDEELKKSMERACSEMGMSMTTAFTIFARRVVRDNRIPFDVTGDPFSSAANMSHLEAVAKSINEGRAKLVEHDIVEVE